MLNKDRFTNGKDLLAAFEADPCMHQAWCLANWMFAEYSENRLEYLKNLDAHVASTVSLTKEIKRLEKAAARKET